jgi:2'-5' RNA ligase
MPYALEIYFDSAGESYVRSIWDELAAVGISAMRDSGARPHVSLAVCDRIDLPSVPRLLDRFIASTPSFPIAFPSLGMFTTTELVVFFAPKVTTELLTLHARLFNHLKKTAEGCWAYYSPSNWVPHCTLAMGFPQEQLGRALDISRRSKLPLQWHVSAIGVVEFQPIRHLCVTPFAGAETPGPTL